MRALCLFSVLTVVSLFSYTQSITLYEGARYTGATKTLGVGQHLLTDFNDLASSIKVPAGMVAVIYEHAHNTVGYGISVDLMEDQPDLAALQFNDKVSFVNVFYATRGSQVFVRGAMVNGQYVAGHWERQRARPQPQSTVAVVSPPIPGPVLSGVTELAVNGPTTAIRTLGTQTAEGRALWQRAMQEQQGIIGNDFRGIEEIGSAAFQRASTTPGVPNFINFWYPQKQRNDHRSVVYFKRTLAGKVKEVRQVNIPKTFPDFDVCIDIIPDPKFTYLISDAHPRQYTGIMDAQWKATGNIILEQSGQPNCDSEKDKEEFTRIEAEIAEDYWPQGNRTFGRARLADLALIRTGKDICVYGTWIYDKGHCCHPEIHPAEQLWWNQQMATGKKYNLNVLCDASGRYWWRKQMDDGTKLKPWGAPPVKGLFAIAFEYTLPKINDAAGYATKQFEVANIQHYNVTEYPNANQTYHLVYQNKNIISFIPHNNAFRVSFEHVGTAPDAPNKIRGFLVIETSVGKSTQIATSIKVKAGNSTIPVKLPPNSTAEQAPEAYEDRFFKKDKGHYLFTVTETTVNRRPVVGGTIR